MPILLIFAFIAGVITILSPCILPVLPIILAGSATGGNRRPLGIITGFILSFTVFTLFAFSIINFLGLSPDTLRYTAIALLGFFGLSLVVPQISEWIKKIFSSLANQSTTQTKRSGFTGGVIVGLSLGLVWTPCVGPIISSVITLAATSSVSYQAVALTLAYTIGTAIPMFLVMIGGRKLLHRVPGLLSHTEVIQKIFGVLMVLLSLAMIGNLDRKFQSFILETFPNYGSGLTSIEDNTAVRDALKDTAATDMPEPQKPDTSSSPSSNQKSSIFDTQYPLAPNPNFTGATKWLNSDPLTLEKLKGKVVLVDFWTYTCINCIRTFPYLTSWDEKYRDQGLVIIGVHAPEFAFEQLEKNVLTAMKDYNIKYPVVQDNNFKIWKSYDNHYWPAHYLIDAQGRVRDTHFGEGKYEETEKKIQELLKEAGEKNINTEVTKELPSKNSRNTTHETYLGLARMEGIVENPDQKPTEGENNFRAQYVFPSLLPKNQFAFGGRWSFDEERAMPKSGAVLDFTFEARQVFLVMRGKGKVKVSLDSSKPIREGAGKDVQEGVITLDGDRLYEVINLPQGGEHRLELSFPEDGVELYAFTFG